MTPPRPVLSSARGPDAGDESLRDPAGNDIYEAPEAAPTDRHRSRPALAPGLYLVATPIGNLEDITLRALRVLREADRIACEDTRQTHKLLHHFGIQAPTVSYHQHNEAGRSGELLEQLRGGARVAVVSDAGTPGIADPGGVLVRQAIAAGVAVYPIPGSNAALSALVASGLPTEQFQFLGFLPSREGQRRTALEELRTAMLAARERHRDAAPPTQIFYEAPHRILDTLADVAGVFGPGHQVAIARELTKLHEEFLRGEVQQVRETLAARESVRGEIVLLLSGEVLSSESVAPTKPVGSFAGSVRALLAEGLDERSALKRVAREHGLGKSEAYREWQRQRGR